VNLFYQPLIPEGVHHLDQEESRHCIKVLRKTTGDNILITDGKGHFYDASISRADGRQCEFSIVNTRIEPTRDYGIHIAISPTKNADRLEWFVEKATELGVDKISLLDCKHTERSFLKKDRLEKVAVSAMKQSLKARLPHIGALIDFKSFINNISESERYIAYVDQSNPNHLKNMAKSGKHYVVLVGPEGDFSLEELVNAVEKGFQKVSLGPARLRTETAGMVACNILNLLNS
jgi:16S rRNA (uracil1498-N3)-methyltransferase